MKNKRAICVDMGCSANLAVANFRNINFVQFLIGADNLDGEYDTRV
jgi:hypothetical protein